MNKKGILFTITTFLLLWPLFILNLSYLDRNNELQNIMISSTMGDKIRFLEDDITNDVYYDLVDINFSSVSRNSENITLTLNGPILSVEKNHFSLMQEYKEFIEDEYSNLSNIEIRLTNFTPSFVVEPYSSSFLINSTKLSVTTQKPMFLKSLQIKIALNTIHSNLITNSSPVDSGNNMVYVQIVDRYKNHLLQKETAFLNPNIVNSAFNVKFSDNSSLQVQYGDFLGMDGSLVITASNLMADITFLKFTYNTTNEKIRITSGELNINSPNEAISKQTQIVLFEE